MAPGLGLVLQASPSILTYDTDNLVPLKLKHKMDGQTTANHPAPDGYRYTLVPDPHEKIHEYQA